MTSIRVQKCGVLWILGTATKKLHGILGWRLEASGSDVPAGVRANSKKRVAGRGNSMTSTWNSKMGRSEKSWKQTNYITRRTGFTTQPPQNPLPWLYLQSAFVEMCPLCLFKVSPPALP
jgi:hypothetical protein